MDSRIFRDPGVLVNALSQQRKEKKSVVLVNGCFDIIHVGHIRYLREAASLGDIVVAALNDDDSAGTLKGEGRPVVPEEERAEILLAVRYVDYVLIFGEPTVDGIIKVLRPDIHAKGTDYTAETVPERATALSIGCRTVIVGDPKDHSSRAIIERVRGEGESGSL